MTIRITLLRHGQPQNTSWGSHLLSEEGRAQAMKCRGKLDTPQFDCILHSPHPRTEETARLVAGLNEEEPTTALPTLLCDNTHPGAEVTDAAFKNLGHAPLARYYDVVGVRACMEDLALTAFGLIDVEIQCRKAKEILVVGDGVLLLPLCMVFADKTEPFMDRVLGDCEGYRITMEAGQAVLIEAI